MSAFQFLRDCVHAFERMHARQDRARHHRHEGLRALQLPPPDISQVSWAFPHITGTTKRDFRFCKFVAIFVEFDFLFWKISVKIAYI
jgi:hypothetical protein